MKSFNKGFKLLGVDISKLDTNDMTTCFECSEQRKAANQKKKVLKVYPKTGFYKCYHCDIEGQVDSDEWIDQTNDYKPQKPIYTPRPMQTPQPQKQIEIKPFILNDISKEALYFLSGRGISEQTAKTLKLSQRSGVLVFNYYKEDQVVGAKYRKISDKQFYQHAGCEKYLYNLDNLNNQETIILVEGEFDVCAIVEAGFLNVGSVSQGAPNEGQEIGTKLQCLDNSIDYIKNAKKVIIFTDNDPNGNYLEKVLIERFGTDRCAVVEKLEGCKDANDVLLKYGKDKLIEIILNAKETPIEGVRTLDQAKDKMIDIYHNGYRKGVSTMVRELDGVFSFYYGWWYLWHGIPNSGKSAFVNFLMMCMSVHHGWKWAVFSPEHYPEEDFYTDMIEILTGKSTDIESNNRLSLEEVEVAMDFVGKHFFFVYPQADNISNTSSNVLEKIKELKLSKGINGYLIDPYNQLMREGSENIDVYLERTLTDVDYLNKTHNLVGNIVAHPRTMYKEKGEEDYKKSTTYEVAGGAMWYNKSYGSVNIHRPFNQSDKRNCLVEIDVQKIKSHKRAGKPACKSLNYDIKTGWYKGLDGSCALEGEFEKILSLAGINTNSFRQKMEDADKIPLDQWGEQLPF